MKMDHVSKANKNTTESYHDSRRVYGPVVPLDYGPVVTCLHYVLESPHHEQVASGVYIVNEGFSW
jgi:hypothetical protein